METEKPVKNKKRNIIVFFVLMIFALFLFEQIMYQLYPTIARMILYGKFGSQVIIEGVCAIIILIVLLLFKNSYVFTERKKSFISSIFVGGYILFYSALLLIASYGTLTGNINILDVGSLALYCLLIGIFEEFLCRGWIQNEFIERFANNRKQVIISILLSSIIFGGMHISNIWVSGQSVIDTMSQIVQAVGMGFLLGSIYFRTKNIWSVIFLHGFWDFAIFLGEINTIKECSQGTPTLTYQLALLSAASLFCILYIVIGLYILRKDKTQGLIKNEELTEEEILKSRKTSSRYIFISVVIYFIILNIPLPEIEETCYEYKAKELYYEEIRYPLYDRYIISENNINLEISLKNNKLLIKDLNTNNSVKYNKEYVDDFIVIKDSNKYKILIIAYNDYETDTEVYYSEFIEIDNINNSQDYLEKLIKSFVKLDKAPTISNTAYIEVNNRQYIILETSNNEQLLVDNNDLFILQRTKVVEEQKNSEVEDISTQIVEQMINQE